MCQHVIEGRGSSHQLQQETEKPKVGWFLTGMSAMAGSLCDYTSPAFLFPGFLPSLQSFSLGCISASFHKLSGSQCWDPFEGLLSASGGLTGAFSKRGAKETKVSFWNMFHFHVGDCWYIFKGLHTLPRKTFSQLYQLDTLLN